MSVYIIAEIGPNHNGDLELARDMIRQIAKTGVNAIKFQLSVPDNVYSADSYKADYQIENDGEGSPLDMARRIQLPATDHLVLYEDCRAAGVDYLCTAFDIDSLRFLDENFDLAYFKIASGEIFSLDTLEFMAERHRPILLSTGMGRMEDIAVTLDILQAKHAQDISILHCVSNYPAPVSDINLRFMTTLAQEFGLPVGFSDHSLGNECCLAAAAMGATVLEKHVTLDCSMPGPDHKASATVGEMAELVRSVHVIEKALGVNRKVFSETELEVRQMARKSIVAARNIAAGERISKADICYKRPGTGFSPLQTPDVIGRTANRPIIANRVILAEWLR